MKIAISVGHGKYIRGARGSPIPPQLDEVDEACAVVKRVATYLRDNGVGCEVFFDETSTDQSTNLANIVGWHNSRSRDYDVSCHFNAYQNTSKPMGVEVLFVTQEALAYELSSALATTMGLPNRGAKYRSDLYFLNNTNKPAILIETCFCDSDADGIAYRANFDEVCKVIAEVVGNIEIGEEPPDVEEPPIEAPGLTRVEINTKTIGDCIIDLNGQEFSHGEPDTLNRLVMTLKIEGEVKVVINGQDYNNTEATTPTPIQPNHRNIICTVFGGVSDPNNSAYDEHFITDTELGVALPYKFSEPRPKVRVFNTQNELSVLCEIVDVGPWHTNDVDYVRGNERPAAEPPGSIIDGGPNDGELSNGAGIDLTVGAASALGIEGKGVVHWRYEDDVPTA